MQFTSRLFVIVIALFVVAGCGLEDGEQPRVEPMEVEHSDVRALSLASMDTVSAELIAGLRFLEESEFAEDIQGDSPCPIDSTTGEPSCEEDRLLADDFEEERQILLDVLENGVFIESNVEADEDYRVTYLLAGASVCGAMEFEDDDALAECVSDVDALEIRVVAERYSNAMVSMDVEVGPERKRIGNLYAADEEVALEVDLDGLKSLEGHIRSVFDEESDDGAFPDRLEGVVLIESQLDEDRVSLAVSSVESVVVESSWLELTLPAKSELARIDVDRVAELANASLDLPALHAGAEMEIDSEAEPVWMGIELPAFSAGLGLLEGEDRLEAEYYLPELAAARLFVNDVEVAEAHLNQSMQAEVARDGEELLVTIDALFDLELVLGFAAVQEQLSGLSQWLYDDVLQVSMSGEEGATVGFGDALARVVEGSLLLKAESIDAEIAVEEGQCLVESGANEGSDHPFAGLSAGVCGE